MVRQTFGKLVKRSVVVITLSAVAAAQEFPKMDSSWRVFVGGQSFAVRIDGSFTIPNVSALDQFGPGGPGTPSDTESDDFLRVIGIRAVEGVTTYAYSDLFRFREGQDFSIGELTLSSSPPPFPQSISAASDDVVLTSAVLSSQVRATGFLLDGSTLDVSASAQGTSYRTSNANILTVDSEGVVTGVSDGVAYVTVRHEGSTASVKVVVALDDLLTQVIGFAQVADGSPVAGARMAISAQGLSTVADSDGRFNFNNVATSLGPIRVGTPPITGPIGLKGTSKPIVSAPGDLTDAGILVLTEVFASPKIGMVADDFNRTVTVFETTGNTILGKVQIPLGDISQSSFRIIGDCSITRDGTMGFVTDFFKRVWVIDLTVTPPALATGPLPNPIPISNNGEDTTITPNNRFLVVSDGANIQPVSVVEIATQTEISSLLGTGGFNSVVACPDGTVLVTSSPNQTVSRLLIDKFGNITDTGKFLSTGNEPNNSLCSPTAAAGVMVEWDAFRLVSFSIPSFQVVDTQLLAGGLGVSAVFSPFGDRIYARSNNNGPNGAIEAFGYNSNTGSIASTSDLLITVPNAELLYGMDPLDVDPTGAFLYVSAGNVVGVYSTIDGALVDTIPLEFDSIATGITVR